MSARTDFLELAEMLGACCESRDWLRSLAGVLSHETILRSLPEQYRVWLVERSNKLEQAAWTRAIRGEELGGALEALVAVEPRGALAIAIRRGFEQGKAHRGLTVAEVASRGSLGANIVPERRR